MIPDKKNFVDKDYVNVGCASTIHAIGGNQLYNVLYMYVPRILYVT